MATQKPTTNRSSSYIIAVLVFVVVVVAAYLAIGRLYGGSQGGFGAFSSAFASAQRVAIYAGAFNGTLGSTATCANKLITSLIVNAHRNSTTIDYFIVNQSSCTYAKNLGTPSFNSITTTVGGCFNISRSEPAVYINYSATNTTKITPNHLYTSGNAAFLGVCGIATELG